MCATPAHGEEQTEKNRLAINRRFIFTFDSMLTVIHVSPSAHTSERTTARTHVPELWFRLVLLVNCDESS